MTAQILAVDDSATMRHMLSATLTTAGHVILLAENGQEGLDVLKSNEVDVIITDIHMPVMDGFTFIQKLHEGGSYRATPVLVLTTENSDEKKQQGRDAGATGWIVKPFDPDKLVDVVRRVSQ